MISQLVTWAAADAAEGMAGVLSLLAVTPCAKQARTTESALLLSAVEFLPLRISGNDQERHAHT